MLIYTAFKGKKYAMVMLQQLHYLLAPEGALPAYPEVWGQPPALSPEERMLVPPAMCSLLSSDIGSSFYEKCTIGLDKPGWVVDPDNQHQIEWSIKPITRESLPPPSDPPSGGDWTLVYDRDMPALTSDLSILAKASLRDAQPSLPIALQQDPASEGLLDFIHRRSTFGPQPEWRDISHPDWPANEPRAVRKHNADGTETIVLFTISNYELAPETFLITYIHNLLPGDVSSLLDKLDQVCAGTGLKKGLVWDIAHDSILGKAWTEVEGRQAECSQRAGIDGHLLALAWYTPTGEGEFVDRQMYNWL
jgi:hypothetical protein